MISLSFSFVQLIGSVSNESLELLGQTNQVFFCCIVLNLEIMERVSAVSHKPTIRCEFPRNLHGIQQEFTTQFLHRWKFILNPGQGQMGQYF